MKDHIVRAITPDGCIRADAITSRDLTERARNIHKCLPLATAALGRTLAAASLMGSQLKFKQASVTIQILGEGPLGSIIAVSDSGGNVRGYVQNPAADLPRLPGHKLDVGRGIGSGQLVVVRDMGLKEPFTGIVNLISGEIAEDIAAYYSQSEQLPTACALGVLVHSDQSVRAAGGYILQLLPGASEDAAIRLENAVHRAGPVTKMLDSGMSPADILFLVLDGFSPEIMSQTTVEYICRCSHERIEGALASLGRRELLELANEQEIFEITCQFCDRRYAYTSARIRKLAQG